MASEIVTLEPGESKEIVFTFIPPEPGHYTVAVDGLVGMFEVIPIEGQTLWGHFACNGIGVVALIKIGGFSVYSDPNGDYCITVPIGVYDVVISAPGHETQVFRISTLPGDANCDGVINMADATMVERIILGLDPWTPSADANQDGYVNMADATFIERIILGLDQPPDTIRFDVELVPTEQSFSLEGGTWDAEMPFETNSRHRFDITFKNTSGQGYDYNLRMEFPYSGSGTSSGSLPPGMSVSLRNNWYMPYSPGIYNLTLEVTIDGVFIGDFVVSEVEVA